MNYPSMTGIVVATLLIAVPFVGFLALVVDVVMILRYVFGYRAPGSPEWSIHHPSTTSLVVVWVVAVLTVVVYPLALYMTWRFIVEYRDQRRAAYKACTRCAETIRAAALVCRYCGQEFDPASIPQPAARPSPTPGDGVAGSDLQPARPAQPYRRGVVYLIVGLAAAVVVGVGGLIVLGTQVDGSLAGEGDQGLARTGGDAVARDWPPGGYSAAGLGSGIAYRWLPAGSYLCVPSGSNARLIIPAPNARVRTGADVPRMTCR